MHFYFSSLITYGLLKTYMIYCTFQVWSGGGAGMVKVCKGFVVLFPWTVAGVIYVLRGGGEEIKHVNCQR